MPIVLATYFVLALRWYPGWVDSRFSLQEPLRVVFYGFSHEWPNPGHITHVSRPVWPALLFPVFGLAAWAFFRFWGLPAARYVGQATLRALRPERDWLQWVLRLMLLIILVNHAAVPLNYAVHHRLPTETIHDIVTYGLFPLSLCIVTVLHVGSLVCDANNCWTARRPVVAVRGDGGLRSVVDERLGAVRGRSRSKDRSKSLPDRFRSAATDFLAICVWRRTKA